MMETVVSQEDDDDQLTNVILQESIPLVSGTRALVSDAELWREPRSIWNKPRTQAWWDVQVPRFDDKEWKSHFRVNKATYARMCDEFQPFMGRSDTNFRKCIPMNKRVAVGLFHMASVCELRVTATLFGLGISTVHQIFREFCDSVVEHLLPRHIVFPSNPEELRQAAQEFEFLLKFPQCVGAIDGCHIAVNPPELNAIDYHNYKGFNSIVLLAVVDARYKFTFINVGHVGRNNDSYILKHSRLQPILDSTYFDTVVKDIGRGTGGNVMPLCSVGPDGTLEYRLY